MSDRDEKPELDNESLSCETPDLEGGLAEKPDVSKSDEWNWDEDPSNPYNWPTRVKVHQVVMIGALAFTTSMGVSILSPAQEIMMKQFNISSTVAIMPLSLYALALGLGPVVGGPLSETVGRLPVFIGTTIVGGLFTLGIGFCKSFAGICILRFLAGFCLAPSLAISAGTINETFRPEHRAIPSTTFILMPFLGPGIGPVIGSFVVSRKSWPWTQWTILFFLIFTMITMIGSRETFHAKIKRRRSRELGLEPPPTQPLSSKIKLFVTVALLRPVQMLFTEPIVTFTCLYIACEFGTLFSFFAAIPLVFQELYGFGLEDSGLVFLAIVVGCTLGVITVLACDFLIYQKKSAQLKGQPIPPELRLYPALIGSIGLPVGLFWFAWASKASISWASPTFAIMIFAWGNLCVFVTTSQYIVDTYHGMTVASAFSANSLARYVLAAAFPLFTIQMYTNLGIGWASSLLGFIALGLLPVPWVFFLAGKKLRSMSKFQTA
ncbi:hypothetical protein N7488_011865 [Penicillium malachiteum]|nr:hypothetical protein N7488_011865 [Penicillium malachiteum]